MNVRFSTVLRWALGLIFVLAGGAKIAEPMAFFAGLLSYRVPLPEIFWRVTAVGFPWFELFIGSGLILDFWAETIRPTACMLSLIFIIMLSQAMVRGLDLDCGCFGAQGRGWFERPEIALVRATLLFAAALYMVAAPSLPAPARKFRIPSEPQPEI